MVATVFLFGTTTRAAEPDRPAAGVLRLTADTPWVLSSDEPEALQRALADVKADWRRVFGHAPLVVTNLPASWSGPVVYLGWKAPWLKELVKDPFPGRESFVLRTQPDTNGRLALVGTGADLRGSIYAAYALSEEILGVDPWHYWTDHPPVARDQIEVPAGFNQRFGPPTFKYRGWFINDEDLLGGYAPDPLRENVFSLEMWDRICEVLLRLRGNLLVPGTFTFPDERAQELASRRGLALNMHHILVVGLNTYRWPKDLPFSYAKHPDIMERYWQTCIDAFKDKEVVWTVGYRGKHDRPFWKDEPELTTPEQRGALISRAIAKQVELIRKTQPDAPMIANLWVEGADLFQAGLLKLPKGVTVVWPDDGMGLIRDEGRVQAGQGIYYHTAMLNGNANQLSELVNPGRIYGEVGRFARAGATEFFLVNVSDVRPVPLSTECAMRFVWNAAPYLQKDDQTNMDEWLAGWSRRQFGPQAAGEVASVYRQYFDIPYMCRATRFGENTLHHRLQRLDAAADAALTNGKPLSKDAQTQITNILNLTAANRKPLADLLARAETVAALIPGERKPFYQAHVLTPIHIHHDSCAMLEAFATGLKEWGEDHKPQALTQLDKAWQASDSLFAALHQAEYGKWDNWYIGERFVGLEFSRDCVRRRLSQLRGEPVPPTRKPWGYPELYDYQVPFQQNFPLLYPARQSAAPSSREQSARETDPKKLTAVVADAVLRDFPDPPPFNWGEGVLLSGMMRAYELTGDTRYRDFVQRFADHWQQEGIGPLLARTGKLKGYCGHWGPGFSLLMLRESTRESRYGGLPEQILDFMSHRAERTQDGGLSHFSGKPQLWVDTLDMCCPVFSHASRILGKPEWQDEAARQLAVFAKHLQDPQTGLFYHMWDEAKDQHTPAFWGRGNGWVVMSYTEVLKNAPAGSAAGQAMRQAFEKQIAGLVPLQDKETGLWRTVLDAPETYLETSCSAMFLYGMAESRRLHLAAVPDPTVLNRAWQGLTTQVDARGRVIGVSGGTGPADKARYATVPVGTYTWGTGAFLLAACAYAESGLSVR